MEANIVKVDLYAECLPLVGIRAHAFLIIGLDDGKQLTLEYCEGELEGENKDNGLCILAEYDPSCRRGPKKKKGFKNLGLKLSELIDWSEEFVKGGNYCLYSKNSQHFVK